MDAKITMSFDRTVINRAKKFADSHNMSLSRLTEFLYEKMTSANYRHLEDLPISDWVNMVSEGGVEYKPLRKSNKQMKEEFFNSRK